jgi:subtilisin family serine protease
MMRTVIVTLRAKADLTTSGATRAQRLSEVVTALQATAGATQRDLSLWLAAERARGTVGKVVPFWVFNGLSVTATATVIRDLAARPEVESVRAERVTRAPARPSLPVPGPGRPGTAEPEPNIDLVRAPDVWSLGFTGEGMVVANMDTGVSLSHPDLSARWRGGSGGWFDPNGEHPDEPIDVNGHGTWTMGVMAGGDSGGSSVGMAPDAQWIAVKIFDDRGVASTTGIHQGLQWLLDPDGDPTTADAPNVVNNSWSFSSPGCDLEFEPDLQAYRAAGILSVFAAGNGGPGGATDYSPANNPDALAVGATDDADATYAESSRGPSGCQGPQTLFPTVVAPGVDVLTTDLFGLYYSATGTSMAAPHVAGGLALLLQAFPNLGAADQEAALAHGAVDLEPAGPDQDHGLGRLDVLASFDWLAVGGRAQPMYLSAGVQTAAPGTVAAPREDVLLFDGARFTTWFDGSDVGLAGANVDATTLPDEDSLLLSFARPVTLDGVGTVGPEDIVRFDASSLGEATAGTFAWYFDGSDVGLAARGEDVDALAVLADGRLLLSTKGRANVPGAKTLPQDVLTFTPLSLGADTSGNWGAFLDGSDVGLESSEENVNGLAVDTTGDLLVTTRGAFAVDGVAGGPEDVFRCTPSSLGTTSACGFSALLVLDGSAWGFGQDVDALALPSQ